MTRDRTGREVGAKQILRAGFSPARFCLIEPPSGRQKRRVAVPLPESNQVFS